MQLPPTSSLRVPPIKPGFATERYDSVGGVTGGSQVYICMLALMQLPWIDLILMISLPYLYLCVVYGDGRAYPKYLVTYKP